jgi:hypothetical protein
MCLTVVVVAVVVLRLSVLCFAAVPACFVVIAFVLKPLYVT